MAGLAVGDLPSGQGLEQVLEILLALVLCSLIGLEREVRHKAAGLRTHALVGLGSALFVLISAYGFRDVTEVAGVSFDPSRIAAQIVSGIGFIGGGLIFVRRGDVQGLTTAATVWLASAIGAACAAGLPLLAVVTTAAYFVVALGYLPVSRRLPRSQAAVSRLHLSYRSGSGALRAALLAASDRGFQVTRVSMDRESGEEAASAPAVLLDVRGRGSMADLAAAIAEIDGVGSVTAGDANEIFE